VSLRDDFAPVRVTVRLAVHLAAAAIVASAILAPFEATPVALARVALATIAIAWGMNLYNFMDGSDGLAATMTVCGFSAYAIAFRMHGDPWVACAAVVAGAVAFLAVNRPAASLFMGDVGAVPLGFLAAAAGLAGIVRGAWPPWFPLLAFLPFALDATATLARRVLRGERVAQAHRTHYYQRLLRMGFGHAGTLAVYAVLMAACAGAAVACLAFVPSAGYWVLAASVAVHAALFATIDYHWARTAETR
jgi:UDP-N-acetylmuramyl pentapeptide phosphotransferase/UDP-N-acetylglucosamine-1-phosphate transferase